eukprot:GSChrysophyteH1.ASY1.ANO1.483.1 assembled CDS
MDENAEVDINEMVGALEFVFPEIEKYEQHVISDCQVAFTSKNAGSDAYSAGSTFFIGAAEKPRCLLERIAMDIFEHHASRMNKNFDIACSGAEWWSQCIDNRDDIGFHWDRDYDLEERTGELRYPDVGTVTYLTDHGGGTMVLPCIGASTLNRKISTSTGVDFTALVISKPKRGKHMHFDGRLLHAAPGDYDGNVVDSSDSGSSDEESSEGSDSGAPPKRVTFLVNVWFNHRPEGSVAFPKGSLEKMCKEFQDDDVLKRPVLKFEEAETVSPALLSSAFTGDTTVRTWRFCDLLCNYAVKLPLCENSAEVIEACEKHFLKLQFSPSCPARVLDLGIVSDEEEEEEEEQGDVAHEECSSLGSKRKRLEV